MNFPNDNNPGPQDSQRRLQSFEEWSTYHRIEGILRQGVRRTGTTPLCMIPLTFFLRRRQEVMTGAGAVAGVIEVPHKRQVLQADYAIDPLRESQAHLTDALTKNQLFNSCQDLILRRPGSGPKDQGT